MTPKSILIIGAGIAGLAACTKCQSQGFNVKILEARNYIGGRICTDHSLGIPMGRGAAWIHGIDNNPIAELAKKFNAKIAPVQWSEFMIFDRNAHLIPHEVIEKFDAKFNVFLEKAKEFAFQQYEDISLAEALSKIIENESFSQTEMDLFTRKRLSFEGYVGANMEVLSARNWDQEKTWPGDNCFVISSYQSIIEGLAKDCPIELNTVVTEIHQRENDVKIVTNHSIFYADAVIVTVPLGVLKKQTIRFHPALPAEKQKAIDVLGMGLLNITALKFPKAFWPKEPQALFFTGCFDPSSVSVFFNLYHFIEQPILIGYNGGDKGHRLEKLSDDELIKNTMTQLKKIYGDDIPSPDAYINTRWSEDPFSLGSYTHLAVGGSQRTYAALAEPIDNQIFFAGEATNSDYPATTHGAYLTGHREAERIIKIFAN